MQELTEAIKTACQKLFGVDAAPELTRPDEQFGDYATNIALKLAPQLNLKPHDIASQLINSLTGQAGVAAAKAAGPGFINFELTDETLAKAALSATNLPNPNQGKQILVEFGDPNPFKEMHIGHVYSYIVGDAMSSILEASGAKVERLSYHGDVGLHVAKAIWGMMQDPLYKEKRTNPHELTPELLTSVIKNNTGYYYAIGSKAYELDVNAKKEIDHINQQVYKKEDEEVNKLYEWGKKKSLGYFQEHLHDLGIKPTRQFFESSSAEKGAELVEAHPEVFGQSEGATVYKGERVGLHTRVFITSAGLPTYEAKDLGLAELKKESYPDANRSVIITAHEQTEYFKVMLAALKEFDPQTAEMTTHLYHGFVSLSTGKMSSRTGEVYSALSSIVDVDENIQEAFGEVSNSTRNAAIKYGFLKHRLGSDIVYDVAESFSLEGNSGPYLQYAHARACSILAKASSQASWPEKTDFDDSERSLARKISEYPEIVSKSMQELMPHHICTYLYELAQTFNSFYEKSRIIGDERESLRLALASSYQQVLNSGLNILNIEAPERM
jgi:arginyl-tRNA synthetase